MHSSLNKFHKLSLDLSCTNNNPPLPPFQKQIMQYQHVTDSRSTKQSILNSSRHQIVNKYVMVGIENPPNHRPLTTINLVLKIYTMVRVENMVNCRLHEAKRVDLVSMQSIYTTTSA